MKKKCLSLLMIFAVLLLQLTACGSKTTSAPSEPSSGGERAASTASAAEPEAPIPAAQESTQESTAEESLAESDPVEIPPLAVTLPLEETATVTIWDVFPPPLVGYMDGPWDCTANRLLEEATNIHLEYTSVSTETASEMFNLMVASHVYCDLMYGVKDYYAAGPDAAIADEIILDLTDMAATMPNYQKLLQEYPDAAEHTTGGNLYRFPLIATEQFSDSARGPATRGDWLKEQNLTPPETLEEFRNMLLTFRDAYGGGTYLMDASGFDNAIGGGFGVQNDFYQVDGVVKYGPLEEGFKEYVEYAHQLFEDGLLAPDFYALFGPPTDLISSGTVGVFTADVGMWPMFTSGIESENYETVGFAPPVQNAGEKTHFAQEVSRISEGMSVSTSCADLDTMAAYIDYMYGDEFALAANFGQEGEGFEYGQDGKPHLSDIVLHNTEAITSFAVRKYTLFSYLPHQDIQTRFMDAYDDNQLSTIELWTTSSDSEWILPAAFSLEEHDATKVAGIMGDVETSVDENLLGFVTGSIDLSTYDAFVENLKTMGVEEALDIYQAAFDQYLNQA